MAQLRFGLISDTHGHLHPRLHKLFSRVHSILHAGDVGDQHVLDELALIAPVHAVAGNCDYVTEALPMRRVVELPFGNAGIAHGHAFPTASVQRLDALCNAFARSKVRLILYGHSHIPQCVQRDGVWIVNPGAACRPRFGTTPSVCVLAWDEQADSFEFATHPLDWKR